MTGPRWQHVKEVFQAALDHEPPERAAFVREACAGDTALQAEVESLLAAHERAGSFAERPATVPLGESFGGYQVTGWLGAGGMGEVYRAHDTKLDRDVALKVLPELSAFDPDRLRRFRREAQILASLNHPNIAAIHGIEQDNGRQALVLELVDGPTLADRIAQGPIPLGDALPIATANRRSARSRPRAWHRPSRPEAVEHQAARRWSGEGTGFRARQGARALRRLTPALEMNPRRTGRAKAPSSGPRRT